MRIFFANRIQNQNRSLNSGSWQQLLFFVLPVLFSCSTLTTQTGTVVRTVDFEPAAKPESTVADDFELSGRVSVHNAQQRFSGNVRWHHTSLDDTVLLLSPLGQAVAEIYRNHKGVSFTTSKRDVYYARNVEDLTADMLGWRLPLDGLQYWVQGHHSPRSAASVDFDSEDRVVAIRQNGWEIFFRHDKGNTKLSTQKVVRPRIIQLQFEDLNIRMVVDDWTETPDDTL